MKLQILSVEISQNIENISSQCVSQIPTIINEVDNIKKQTQQLKHNISMYEERIASMKGDSEKNIQILKELDIVKNRMEGCYSLMHEADKFKQMLKEIEKVFTSENYKEMAVLLRNMNNSYDVVKRLTNFSGESDALEAYTLNLINKIEPILFESIKNHDINETKNCINILEMIDRINVIYGVYETYIHEISLNQWKSFELKEFEDKISSFYEEILPILHSETSYASQIFADQSIIYHIITTSQKVINEEIKKTISGLKFDKIISIHQKSIDFLNYVTPLIKASNVNALKDLKRCIYSPYVNIIRNFSHLEKKNLLQSLETIKPKRGDYNETIQNVSDSLPKLFKLLDISMSHCFKLTQGSEFEDLLKVLSNGLVEYLVHLSKILKYLKEIIGIEDNTKKNIGADSEWNENDLQGAIKFLEIVLTFEMRLNLFTRELSKTILAHKTELFGNRNLNELDIATIPCAHLSEEKEKAERLIQILLNIENDPNYKILPSPLGLYESLITNVQNFVFDLTFNYIKLHLVGLSEKEVWKVDSNLNEIQFSYSPQFYIKLIVEHLLLLPQILEPYDANEILRNVTFNNKNFNQENIENEPSFAQSLVTLVSIKTQSLFVDEIRKIQNLTDSGASQLSIDISHIFNVLRVLGLPIYEELSQIQSSIEERIQNSKKIQNEIISE